MVVLKSKLHNSVALDASVWRNVLWLYTASHSGERAAFAWHMLKLDISLLPLQILTQI